jgi:flagellar FliL protein
MAEQVNELVPPAAVKKRKWPLLIGGLVVLLVGAGGGYFYFARHAATGQASAPKQAVELAKSELYLALEPAFVENFNEGESSCYLQVAVTLMAHDDKAIDTAKAADPVIRDAMVSLLSNQKVAEVDTPAGRKKLQTDALAAVQKVVQARLGRPGIEALYFTSFVIQ